MWKKPRKSLRLENLEDRSVPSAFAGGDQDANAPNIFIPQQFYQANLQTGFLTGPTAGTPLDIARNYMMANAAKLGFSPADVDDLEVITNYVTDTTGVTHLGFQQRLNGLLVKSTNISTNVTADGRIINFAGYIVRGIDRFNGLSLTPPMSAIDAVRAAATQLGLTPTGEITVVEPATGLNQKQTLSAPGISKADMPMLLQYVATPDGGVALTWDMQIQTPVGHHWYSLNVDGAGAVIYQQDYVDHASYKVYPIPGISPQDVPQTSVTDPHIFVPTPAVIPSPFGWHDTNGVAGPEFTNTQGNNVQAYLDRNDDDQPDSGGMPDGGASLNFNFTFDPAQSPLTNKDEAVTNLFYWNNILHDVHYLYGFNEAARNFQTNTYGRGGVGNDAVHAEAQDGADVGSSDNAFFATPPDGQPGQMAMFEFTFTSPRRDSDNDAEVIVHEGGHGVSNRLTNNGSGLNALQSGGMGEGWSDWWSIMFTQKSASETTSGRGVGTYVLGQPPNGPGIRDFPYDFDITNQNLETFIDFNNGGQEVHTSGTRWAATLWDLNHLLIQRYGFEPNIYNVNSPKGNIIALQLVMDALKLQPSNPSFIDARDAILQADMVRYGGANQGEIWTAFARRGLGFSASTPDGNSSFINVAFDLPPNPNVTINQAAAQVDPTNIAPITYTVVFDRPVTGFTGSDINFNGSTVGGTLVANVIGSGALYTVTVTGMSGEGNVVASIPAGAAQDGSGTGNKASTSTDNTVRFDAVGPTVTVNQGATQPDPVANGPVTFDVVFGDPVTGFTASDVSFAGSTIGGTLQASVSGSGKNYSVTVSGMSGLGTVMLSVPAGAATDSLGNTSQSSTSTDNTITVDTVGQIQFESATYTRNENGGTVAITATRTGGSANAVAVDINAVGGTATAGSDFTPAAGTINWGNGETGTKSFIITIIDDILEEPEETVDLVISNPTNGAVLGGLTAATLKIEDVEEGVLQYTASSFGATEDSGLMTVSVTRGGGSFGAVTVDYATADGTARNGLDYTATSGTLSWADGETGTKTFDVAILPDDFNEGRENVLLNLTNATGGGHLAGISQSRVSIAPSDPKGPGTFLDTDGDKGVVRISGGGTLGYYLTDPDGDGRGPIELIEVAGTNPLKTVVSLAATKVVTTADGGRIGLGAVTGTAIRTLSAAKYNLDGDGVNLPTLGALVIADVKTGASIQVGGTPLQKTRIAAGIIEDGTTIDVDSTVTSISALRIGQSTITAPSIGSIVARGNVRAGIAGNFAADVSLSGAGVLTGKPTLRVLRAAGEITTDSSVMVNGLAGTVSAGAFNGTFNAGGLTSMVLKGMMGGDLTLTGAGVLAGKPALGALTVVQEMTPEASVTAPSIGTMLVKGFMHGDVTVTGQGVLAGLPALKSLIVTGAVDQSDISVDGIVTLVKVGLFQNSRFYAGYAGAADGSGNFTNTGNLGAVGTFQVTSPFGGFENSTVIASSFKTVKLAAMTSQNGGNRFGFLADTTIGSLTVGVPLFVYNPGDPGDQGLDDFVVKIV